MLLCAVSLSAARASRSMTVSRRDRSPRATMPRSRHDRRKRLTVSALVPALGHLALEHLGGARMAAQELREPLGRDHHRGDLIQRGHGGRPDPGGQRGPLPDHVPLAAHGHDLLGLPGGDADLDPAGVDDHHLGGVVTRAAQYRAGTEDLLHPGRRQRHPLGIGQRVPEAPRGRPFPAHTTRGDRGTRDLAFVAHRTALVGSVVPSHG